MASRSTAVRRPVARSKSRARSWKTKSASLHLGHPAILLGITTLSLVVLGLVMILSASSVTSFATYGSSFLFFQKQLIWAAIGLAGFAFFVKLDYHRLKGFGYGMFLLSSALMLAVLIPGLGTVVGGSSRWLRLGPLSFQPSELAKLSLILFAADVFSRKKEKTFDDLRHTLLPMMPALGILIFLGMMQPDLGTTMLLGSIGMGMLFIAGAPLLYLAPMTLGGAGLAVFAALSSDYRRVRVLAFMDPWKDPLVTGYHTIQSLIALGSGGWFGVGLGASRQKWAYVPNAHTDFIFAILGEEMGLLGTIVVLSMFGFLTYLGIRTARKAPDRFGMLIAAGVTIWISVQALVNIGAVTGSLPITGVPLPLVSFGGTSLVICLVGMGILINIARQAREPHRTTGARKGSRKQSPGKSGAATLR